MLDERPGLIDVELARPGRVQHLRPHEIGDQKDADGTQFARHIADIKDDEMIVQRHIGGRVEGTCEAALHKAVEPVGQAILVFATDIASEHAIEISQEWGLPSMCTGVCRNAYLSIGFIQRPIEQAFLTRGERGDATGSAIGQHDVEEGMQRLHFIGQPISPAAILDVGRKVGAGWQQIKGVEMLLGAGSQPYKVSTQGSTEVLVFLFRVDHHHLQARACDAARVRA